MNEKLQRTVTDIILESKDQQIRRLQLTGICMSLFYMFMWLGTMIAFALYVRAHSGCS